MPTDKLRVSAAGAGAGPLRDEGNWAGSIAAGGCAAVPDCHSETAPDPVWSDEQLVAGCLAGRQESWSALIDKYRCLIYSIPIRFGFQEQEANEVFQEACLILLRELPKLREPRTIAAWLIKTTMHMCIQMRRREKRLVPIDASGEATTPAGRLDVETELITELERAAVLREAILSLPPRCRQMVEMLFFHEPVIPYVQVAEALGIAKGSVGFIRMRCLRRLRRVLEEKGFCS